MYYPGQILKRTDIHKEFQGSGRHGISTPKKFPFIFIFSSITGEKYGYKDGWNEDKTVFSYTGEGPKGTMKFTKRNSTLRDHEKLQKQVFLFISIKKAYVEYEGELELISHEEFLTTDKDGDIRKAIRFLFKRKTIIDSTPTEIQKLNFNEPKTKYITESKEVTEQKNLINTRVGQGKYRREVLQRWGYKCAVTKFDDIRILIASHIVPWKNALNNERLDVNNGILLSPVYDALFDKHIISFEDSGEIIVSNEIKFDQLSILGITGKEKIKGLSEGNKVYLKRHRLKLK